MLIILIAPVFSAANIEKFFVNDLAKEYKLQIIEKENIRPSWFGRTYMVEMRDGIKLAIGASMVTSFVVLGVVWIGRKIKYRIQVGENRDKLEKQINLDQLKVKKNKKQFFFDDWD